MTKQDIVIEDAKSYLGIKEQSTEHKKIIDLYNKGKDSSEYTMTLNDPWCAAFVGAIFAEAGMSKAIPISSSCDRMIEEFKSWGRFKSPKGYTAQKGDIIFYNWDGDKISDHTGIVTKNAFGTITTIEGNKLDRGGFDTVGYRNTEVNSNLIYGYGQPKWDEESDPIKPEEPGMQGQPYDALSFYDKNAISSFPVLTINTQGIWVYILQIFLNVAGDYKLELDGKFGPNTYSAIIDWQKTMAIEVDGIVGKQTWSSLYLMA